MNWLKKLMAGRYGTDQLSFAILLLSMLLIIISGFSTHLRILMFLSYIPLLICILRALSKNVEKRRMENYKFMMLISPVYSWAVRTINRLKDQKTHKYFSCPSCKATLRVPKGKGKIGITCPKCKSEFIRKT